MAECCKLAFFQTAKTLGREIRFKGINCYVTGSEQATGALLMLELDRITSLVKTDETPCRITDVYGWTLNNARAAADRIATDAGIAVYLPEFFQEGDHAPFPADGWFCDQENGRQILANAEGFQNVRGGTSGPS
jgi:hypothetical protein